MAKVYKLDRLYKYPTFLSKNFPNFEIHLLKVGKENDLDKISWMKPCNREGFKKVFESTIIRALSDYVFYDRRTYSCHKKSLAQLDKYKILKR